ncbi:conserved protein of unknown function [Tenacibaculum sp. 190524A02b]|uniref:hypothetical protein n=1 Tax=Tenacibaculum vairaonense TaxID=3137860 RepID=UPI0032B30656
MNHYINQEEYLRAATYFEAKNEGGKYWNIQDVKPMPSELYVNKEVGTSGVVNLLVGSTVSERGVTNFDGNRLTEGRAFAANAISVAAGVADKNTPVHAVDYSFDNVPASLRFATLVVKQKNEAIIKLPINSILNGREDFSNYRNLEAFAFIEPNSITEIDIEYPVGSKIDLADGKALFVSVFIKGFESYQKR